MTKRGFLLGKFMPPHAGHVSLCRAAAELVDELTILVCSMPNDAMTGDQRMAWMREIVPNARIVSVCRDVPQYPEESPDFWPIWTQIVREFHPDPIDFLFAGEEYGKQLAEQIDGVFIPLGARILEADQSALGGVSGTDIREDMAKHWRWLPTPVRRDWVKVIALHGVESVGKSTLAQQLAEHLDTPFVPEYGRSHCEVHGNDLVPADLELIAACHQAMIEAAKEWSGPVLISDTDWLMTRAWNQWLFDAPLSGPNYPIADLYLYLPPALQWVDDGTRMVGDDADRLRFDAICRDELSAKGARVAVLDGPPNKRIDLALQAIAAL